MGEAAERPLGPSVCDWGGEGGVRGQKKDFKIMRDCINFPQSCFWFWKLAKLKRRGGVGGGGIKRCLF